MQLPSLRKSAVSHSRERLFQAIQGLPGLVLVMAPFCIALLLVSRSRDACGLQDNLFLLLALAFLTAITFAIWLNWNPETRFRRTFYRTVDRAEAGDPQGQFELGMVYLAGHEGFPRSEDSARHWLGRAAQAGHPEAEAELVNLQQGKGLPVPAQRRLEDAEPGNQAQGILSRFLDRLPRWMIEAPLLVMTLLAALGLLLFLAGAFLALVLASWTLSPLGTTVFVLWLLGLLGLLGLLCWWLRSPGMKYRSATRRLFTQAGKGDPGAERALALAYLAGAQGLPRDGAQAFWWMRRCAEQGDAQAAYLLAQWLDQGIGQPRNRSAALTWLQRAAEEGHGPAKVLLGRWSSPAEGE